MNNTENYDPMEAVILMRNTIFDDSEEDVKEFDKQRAIISDMNKTVENMIRNCQHGKIKLPYDVAESLEGFTKLYQNSCRVSELHHYKQKLDAGLIFVKGQILPVPPKRDHYS